MDEINEEQKNEPEKSTKKPLELKNHTGKIRESENQKRKKKEIQKWEKPIKKTSE